MADRKLIPVTIPSGTSQSLEVSVGAYSIVGVLMPAAWDAADITFLALVREPSALPKVPVFGKVQDDAGTEFKVTGPAADTYVAIPETKLVGLNRIKVRSGTAGAAVNQTAQRDFFLAVVVE